MFVWQASRKASLAGLSKVIPGHMAIIRNNITKRAEKDGTNQYIKNIKTRSFGQDEAIQYKQYILLQPCYSFENSSETLKSHVNFLSAYILINLR